MAYTPASGLTDNNTNGISGRGLDELNRPRGRSRPHGNLKIYVDL